MAPQTGLRMQIEVIDNLENAHIISDLKDTVLTEFGIYICALIYKNKKNIVIT